MYVFKAYVNHLYLEIFYEKLKKYQIINKDQRIKSKHLEI